MLYNVHVHTYNWKLAKYVYSVYNYGGRIIDIIQIDNLQIYNQNLQIDNLQIDKLKITVISEFHIDNLSFCFLLL